MVTSRADLSLFGLPGWIGYLATAAVCPGSTVAAQETLSLVIPALVSRRSGLGGQPGFVGFSLVHCFLLDAPYGSYATSAPPDTQLPVERW